jgi:hypothetical protein
MIAAEQARMQHFHELERDEQIEAIWRMACSGYSVYGIAAATGISVEQLRLILAERRCE